MPDEDTPRDPQSLFLITELSVGIHMPHDLTVGGDVAEQAPEFRLALRKWTGARFPLSMSADGNTPLASVSYLSRLAEDGSVGATMPKFSKELVASGFGEELQSLVRIYYSFDGKPSGEAPLSSTSGNEPFWYGDREAIIDRAMISPIREAAQRSSTSIRNASLSLARVPYGGGCNPKDKGWDSERCKGMLIDGEQLCIGHVMDDAEMPEAKEAAMNHLRERCGEREDVFSHGMHSLRRAPLAVFARFHTVYAGSAEERAAAVGFSSLM